MTFCVIDLHTGEDLRETLKILKALERYAGEEVHLLRLFGEVSDYDLSCYDGIVLSGSNDMSVYSDPRTNELGKRLRAASKDVKILGICGGNQVLAKNFGYRRLVLKQPEFGCVKVRLTEYGKRDPLFRGIRETFDAYEEHALAVLCAEEERVLAENDTCIQAILYQPEVYGVQFHPEDTPYLKEKMFENFVSL
jgi:GMP synthase (glutamine-hydrolysing)